MLVVIGIIGILASMMMPALARAKGKANQIKCLNHMRQLGLAATMYAEDFGGELPPRRTPPEAWPHKLKPYYLDLQILTCPSDRFGIIGWLADTNNPNRSFIINGFNDHFLATLDDKDYDKHRKWKWAHGIKMSDISQPSETIIFGEKRKGSFHVHMDIDQGKYGNEIEELEHQRHGRGSNYAFADNSVRLLPKFQDLYPLNMWSVREEFRHPAAPPSEPKR
jgi:prepilin-type processing-associated H-X9-DG protein